MAGEASRRRKRMLGLAVALVGALAPILIVLHMARTAEPPRESMALQAVGSIVLGVTAFLAAAAVYALATLTNCLTFDFRSPVWTAFKRRFVVAHLACQTLLLVATVFGAGGLAAVLGALAGATFDSLLVGLLIAGPLVMILVYSMNLWVPLNRSLFKQIMLARGVAAPDIQSATYVGISDPLRSSWGKGVIEDDIGGLWLTPDALVYRGDSQSFEIPRGDVVAIERDVDPGSVAAITGAVHPVVVCSMAGVQRRIRFHAEGSWSLRAAARELAGLTERLEGWRTSQAATGDP